MKTKTTKKAEQTKILSDMLAAIEAIIEHGAGDTDAVWLGGNIPADIYRPFEALVKHAQGRCSYCQKPKRGWRRNEPEALCSTCDRQHVGE